MINHSRALLVIIREDRKCDLSGSEIKKARIPTLE